MNDCATMPEQDWVTHRFADRCYFYPMRDCPGWVPGGRCGRMDHQIPESWEEGPDVFVFEAPA